METLFSCSFPLVRKSIGILEFIVIAAKTRLCTLLELLVFGRLLSIEEDDLIELISVTEDLAVQ